jgi:Na+-translocating ferredoxin:NAD+ oxidoreductase subunit E
MGIGFTFSLTFLGAIREIFGAGTLFAVPLFGPDFDPSRSWFKLPAHLSALDLILAGMNYLNVWQAKRKGVELGSQFRFRLLRLRSLQGYGEIAAQKKAERLEPAKG